MKTTKLESEATESSSRGRSLMRSTLIHSAEVPYADHSQLDSRPYVLSCILIWLMLQPRLPRDPVPLQSYFDATERPILQAKYSRLWLVEKSSFSCCVQRLGLHPTPWIFRRILRSNTYWHASMTPTKHSVKVSQSIIVSLPCSPVCSP